MPPLRMPAASPQAPLPTDARASLSCRSFSAFDIGLAALHATKSRVLLVAQGTTAVENATLPDGVNAMASRTPAERRSLRACLKTLAKRTSQERRMSLCPIFNIVS
jgi:hypothetical protein